MLQVKSQYKIAKRLGASVFEKTQSQKFALSDARAKKNKKGRRGGSDYGRQLIEKQKVRFTFGVSESQLSKYVRQAVGAVVPSIELNKQLEMRADSTMYHAGFASTRRAARQMVNHGHIMINGRRITTPSQQLKVGDKITVRESSRKSPLFASLTDENAESRRAVPAWLSVDINLLKAEVVGEPTYTQQESALDFPTVFEFYSR